jgi:hypothetical protein
MNFCRDLADSCSLGATEIAEFTADDKTCTARLTVSHDDVMPSYKFATSSTGVESVISTYSIAKDTCDTNDKKETTEVHMACDKDGSLRVAELDATTPSVLGECENTIYIKSKSFCKVGDINGIWNWIKDNKWIIFAVFAVCGLLICFTGRKLFRVVLFMTTMIVVVGVGMFFCYTVFLYKQTEQWVGWTTLAVWILIGILAGWIMLKLRRFGIFLLAGWGGVLLGLTLWDAFLYTVES